MNAAMTWASGTIGTALTIASGHTLSITTTNAHFLSAATLTNQGTVVWNNTGPIAFSGNASIVNASGGVWDTQANSSMQTSVAGTQSISNAGTFRRSTGAGTAFIQHSVSFVNTGTLEVQTGTLSLTPTSSTLGGSVVVSSGATLTLGGAATLNAGVSLTGAGTVNITSTTTAAGAVAVGVGLSLSGTLTGTGPVTVNSTMTWSAGTVGAPLVVASGATLSLTTTNAHTLSATTMTNQGTVAWAGTGPLALGGNASVVNESGALWDVQGGTVNVQTASAGTQSFTNAGTLRKTGTTGTLSVSGSVVFSNSGEIQLRLGGSGGGQFDVLALSQPFTFNGTLDVSTTGGFEPRFFHAFNAVTYPSRTNTFTTIDSNGETYIDQYQATALRLRPLADPLENIIRNGTIDTDLTNWLTFATPNMTYLSTSISGGVLDFYRVPPPAGTSNQATVYQETQAFLPEGSRLSASFDLGNSSAVRKRISVLILDSDFSDLAVCTFFLEANTPMQSYMMRTEAGKNWNNAALYFYAASAGANGGAYQLDNVTMHYDQALPGGRTTCHDATVPAAPGGAAGPDLLTNGNFNTGTLAPWGLFGQIQSQIAGGVFEFIKLAGTPAGVVLQNTGQAMVNDQILTSTFQLGNSSGVRKRVTVIIHDNDFSDLSACTFWLDPGQPLSTYTYRTFTTKTWTNATVSVYPATVGADQWLRLDNVTFQRTPGTTIVGTECIEPIGGGNDQRLAGTAGDLRDSGMTPGAVMTGSTTNTSTGMDSGLSPALDMWLSYWVVDGFRPVGDWLAGPSWAATATDTRPRTLRPLERLDLTHAVSASVRFVSTLRADSGSTALVQVSRDGATWETVAVVAPSDGAAPVDVDLGGWRGTAVFVRFALDGVAPDDGATSDTWRIEDIGVDVE
jgi:hypothetical protein